MTQLLYWSGSWACFSHHCMYYFAISCSYSSLLSRPSCCIYFSLSLSLCIRTVQHWFVELWLLRFCSYCLCWIRNVATKSITIERIFSSSLLVLLRQRLRSSNPILQIFALLGIRCVPFADLEQRFSFQLFSSPLGPALFWVHQFGVCCAMSLCVSLVRKAKVLSAPTTSNQRR